MLADHLRSLQLNEDEVGVELDLWLTQLRLMRLSALVSGSTRAQ